eukprot:258485_1
MTQLPQKEESSHPSACIVVPKLKPGTWVRRPFRKGKKYASNGKGGSKYHHFICIHPLLSIGYNREGVVLEHHSIGNNAKIVEEFSKWEICGVPNDKDVATICIKRALHRLGESEYKVYSNNCEHFATSCYKGISISKQVKKPVQQAIGGGGGATLGAYLAIPKPIIAVAPAAKVWGSTTLGAWAVKLGVMAAPVAAAVPVTPVALPVVLGAIGVGVCGYIGVKFCQYVFGDSTQKVDTDKAGYEMIAERDKIITLIEKRIKRAKIDKKEMDKLLRKELFDILDKYWFAE